MKSQKKKLLNVRIPAWLPRVETLIKDTSMQPDRLRAVIHQFFLAWIKDKHIRKADSHEAIRRKKGYFAVSAELLKEVGTKHYAGYVRLLESHDVIRRHRSVNGNGLYRAGDHCTLFRWVVPAHIEGDIPFRAEVISDNRTIKSILHCRDNHRREIVGVPDRIDLSMRPLFQKLKEFTEEIVWEETDFDRVSSDLGEFYFEQLYNGNIFWNSVCEFGNRYHTPYTTLSKRYRNRLRFKGREGTPLVLLDFANSQPFFSSILGDGELISELAPEFLPILPVIKEIVQQPDFKLYKQLCSEGRLYQYFTEGTNITKDEIKTLLFKSVLFAKKRPGSAAVRDFRARFKRYFPSVVALADAIKELDENVLPELRAIIKPPSLKSKSYNDSHKIVPALMQRLESRMVFKHIVPAMLTAGIGPFLTVHDAFIILPDDEEKTRKIIAESFSSFNVNAPLIRSDILSKTPWEVAQTQKV